MPGKAVYNIAYESLNLMYNGGLSIPNTGSPKAQGLKTERLQSSQNETEEL